MRLRPEPALAAEYPGLEALGFEVRGLRVEAESGALAAFLEARTARYRQAYDLASLKDEARIRAYRDFYWKVGIDPTKVRPAAEALLRRVLQGKPLPRINTLVDAYNLASMETRIALAAFDAGEIRGDLRMRRAAEGESFLGIGMDAPIRLEGVEVVVEDGEKLVAVYPYRDADASKVTLATRDSLFLVCGVPGIPSLALREARDVTADLVMRFCGGRPP